MIVPRWLFFFAVYWVALFAGEGTLPAIGSDDPSPAEPRVVRVAVCQTLCIDSDLEGNFRRVAYALEEAAEQGAQIACFPETALLGWINPEAHELAEAIPGPVTDRLSALAAEHGMMICIGLCEKDGDDLYDSVVLISAAGELLAVHRKVNCLPGLMDPPYRAGDAEAVEVVETEFGRVGMLICADTFVEDLVRSARDQRADLLLVPYGWAAPKSAWPGHGQSLADRVRITAELAGCSVVGTNSVGCISSGPWRGFIYGGLSPVACPTGEVLGILHDRSPQIRVFEVPLQRQNETGTDGW